ncbi:MAG: glucosamine-6-phosphate isomerase [Bacteroidetes bacterium]|nr:glucosamine-6-phosphate isomerase [Bacteroidota bacterium]
MIPFHYSPVEAAFFKQSGIKQVSTRIPYILVENFPKLGMLTSLRFLEWVAQNPEGVISLPTGKTPEYFIKWTKYFLDNWDDAKVAGIRKKHGHKLHHKPDLSKLHFVQIDEFYPISPSQHNSFNYYVNNFYIDGFGLDPQRALLINCDGIPLAGGRKFTEVFPDNIIDNSLRYHECRTSLERMQQESIFMIDAWCSRYEQKIRDIGGIGFFLGGIGPDGHIAFNIRGSDHFSTTRLTSTNFETQAVAATDLGGIEISRNRMVITIGLDTITFNPDAVAIIIAAGESKADIVKQSLESQSTNIYPATALQKLPNSRFYLTQGAASRLNDSIEKYYKSGSWIHEKTERAVTDLCRKLQKYGHHIVMDDLRSDPFCQLIPDLTESTVPSVEESMKNKIERGLEPELNQTFLHTGPHHDDIMLGILPHIAHQLRSATNTFHFAIMTSGFTAVTNVFIKDTLLTTIKFLENDLIQMISYPDFFESGYRRKWDKDVYHYLDSVASRNPFERERGLSHRIVRAIIQIYSVKNKKELMERISEIVGVINNSYDGEKNPPTIQTLKGMIREFEEELVWAHFGVQVKNIHHLRLGFYTGDIFTEVPEQNRDVIPILNLIKNIQPTVISLAFDPEGSGPDTHYKVLQTIAEALREWKKEKDLSKLRIWGYRNVWYRFHPAEANVMVPCSLNSMSMMNDAFRDCYLSQVDASFPSYEHDGPFSTLAQKIWVEQHKDIELLLGKNFFYLNDHPRIRASHGLVFFREMNVDEFLNKARELEKTMEG